MKVRTAIITGANGFIGRTLTERLLAEGAEVWAVVRDEKLMEGLSGNKRIHIVVAGFEDYEVLPDNIAHRGFDAFFHFAWAGYGTAANDYRIQIPNVLCSCNAANAAARLQVKRFVFADSFHEFLVSEDDHGNSGTCSIYGTAKSCAQSMCRIVAHDAGMEFIGLMFAHVFGEGDRSSRSVNVFLRRLMLGEDLDLVDGTRLHGWIYIDDCITGVLAAAEKGTAGKIYYVGGAPRTFGDVVTEMRDVINPNSKLNFGVYPDKTYIDFEKIDCDALHRDTGFTCQADLKESIRRTAIWLSGIKPKG